ncbi:tryptophan--tRNA ligase [Paenibacillus allorhizosphaerae]|uniref:Tryptophan--tRNA ligase n=1 Tax=Paenibacillus allorhizosphaerae TaxID=2849866 RepID=A0ABM8VRQ8_9BACL|nr:tryptophan--tRNA ligase [Paenibacillus allorhizosphaerae]CAG7655636.1 Tryptophan--tRNA ligase 2 [Paenibacillus allorhizosphaerae]
MSKQERVLTGDRITGKLHLGHYVGSLKNRLLLQDQYETFILLADVQALTTHFENPKVISENLRNVALDYLSVGLHPEKSTMFVQSMIPEIAELTVYYSMFVTVNALRHNPTIKTEAKARGYKDMYYGFLGYPVSQAADITFCKATLVPVGDDQIPHIEQTRKIVRRFNDLYAPVLVEPEAIVGERLEGLDGSSKMSKSMGNAIFLDSSSDEVAAQIKRAKTDPNRIHKMDPGNPDICPIYDYHSAFRPEGCGEIRQNCKAGKIGCSDCKGLVVRAMNELLEPIREERSTYSGRPKEIDEMMIEGTRKARRVAKDTMTEVREAMGINYFG